MESLGGETDFSSFAFEARVQLCGTEAPPSSSPPKESLRRRILSSPVPKKPRLGVPGVQYSVDHEGSTYLYKVVRCRLSVWCCTLR